MRILIFSNAYKPTISGVVTSISLFRQGLINANHEVHIIAPQYEDYQDEDPFVFRFPALDLSDRLNISLVLPIQPLMEPTVRGIKPDLIHSQHPVWMGDLAAAFASDMNLPLVFTFHTRYDEYAQSYVPIVPELASKIAGEVVLRYMRHCAHIIAPTPSIRDLILSEYPLDVPVSVVPSPVDLNQYDELNPGRVRTMLGLEEEELLLYVGRLSKEKGLDLILRAFVRIIAERPSVRLLLLGEGPYKRALESKTRRLGLSERIIVGGVILHEEVPNYVSAADLFVFSSLTDTQGLVLLEAMTAGTPVVAVEAPGSADVLSEGGGLLVPATEVDFSNAVLSLLADEAGRSEMGKQAIRAAQRYSIPATTARMLEVYEKTIEAWGR
jgi:glycosyltransferase involved in cell wall biosynthesis